MQDDRALLIAAVIVVGLLTLALAVVLALWIISGAVILFVIAIAQGFVGLIAYVAAWVFLLPFMLVASAAVGGFASWAEWAEAKEAKAKPRREREAARYRARQEREAARRMRRNPPAPDNAISAERPKKGPTDPHERYLWANRLPPYDAEDTEQ